MFSLQVFGQKPYGDYGQTIITYEDMKTITKSFSPDVYTAKDGYSYKIGDTLKLGRPSTNKTFAFVTEYSTMMALNGQAQQPLGVDMSGSNTIIKKMFVSGNKRMGYKMRFQGKGICGICPSYFIDFEEAIATGEIQSKGFTKETAIAKLKEAKDLLDLGLMKQVDYDILKESLVKYIIVK
jgi:hypothetical protein